MEKISQEEFENNLRILQEAIEIIEIAANNLIPVLEFLRKLAKEREAG